MDNRTSLNIGRCIEAVDAAEEAAFDAANRLNVYAPRNTIVDQALGKVFEAMGILRELTGAAPISLQHKDDHHGTFEYGEAPEGESLMDRLEQFAVAEVTAPAPTVADDVRMDRQADVDHADPDAGAE